MSVKAMVIGDPHISVNGVKATDLMLKELVFKAKEEAPDFIVVLGDVLDTFDRINSNPLTRATRWLRSLKDIALTIVLIGNHDIRNNRVYCIDEGKVEHPFDALRDWDNTILCDVPKVFNVKGFNFISVPYVPPGKYEESLNLINDQIPGPITAFFSHQEFHGVRTKPSKEKTASTSGDAWPMERSVNITGHYHEAQIIADNLIYPGTARQINFGEDLDKTYAIFHFFPLGECKGTYNGKYEERKTEPTLLGPNFHYYRIPMVTIPLKYSFQFNARDIKEIDLKVREIISFLETGIDSFRLIITGTPEELSIISSYDAIITLNQTSEFKERIKIDFKTVSGRGSITIEDGKVCQVKHKTFSDILLSTISADEDLLNYYKELFH